MNKAKLYKLANTLAGIIVGLMACWYLFSLLKEKSIELNFTLLIASLKDSPLLLSLVFVLMPFNWLIETVKWKQSIKSFQQISFKKSLQSVFFGVSLSLFTPNRIGDLGGRLLHISKANRVKALYSSAVCAYSQLLITILVGLVMMVITEFEVKYSVVEPLLILIAAVLLWFYFASDYLKGFLRFLDGKLKSVKISEVKTFSKKMRMKILLLSALRYTVFCIQFIFLLLIFDPNIELLKAFSAVSIIFFISAIIPTAWISDLPVRTSIAYFVVDYFGFQGTAGLMSSVILWIINLLLPAIVGFFFSPRLNIFSSKTLNDAN